VLDGQASSNNLPDLIELASRHSHLLESGLGLSRFTPALTRLRHWLNRNSKAGSRRNIAYHYDLGNSFYQAWLDSTMTYSSAIFTDAKTDLGSAQTAKYKRLAELADIQPGDRVLEIGCGWGGFAEYAASTHGAHVTGITLSKEQHRFATDRLAKAGLDSQTDIRIQDYRDLDSKFDKIISIEMFEAVGEKYWAVYFNRLAECLKRGGKAALQIITIDNTQFAAYRRNPDFVQKYIFPGGMLPSEASLQSPISKAGLALSADDGFALHYARTLSIWRERFLKAWPELSAVSQFDERFRRMWELYLAYCEGGFRAGQIDVRQILLHHR
jgi:cyclopropane-fatty-acyl-phospholipid synthase